MRRNSAIIVLMVVILASAAGRPTWSEHAENIRATGVVRIATNPGIEPMEYRQNGQLVGYDIDLGNELAKHMGARVEWVVYENLDELVSLLIDGTSSDAFDIVISAMGIDAVRTQQSIAVPYFKSGLTILATRSAADIDNLDDLTGLQVAAVTGSTEFAILSRMRDVTVVAAATYDECINHVNTGNSQAAVLDVPMAMVAVRQDPDTLRVASRSFEDEWYGIYMAKHEKQLFREIRIAVQTMRRDGTLERLNAMWF